MPKKTKIDTTPPHSHTLSPANLSPQGEPEGAAPSP